jgi:hypothetical protein
MTSDPKADPPNPSSDITIAVERETDGVSRIRIGGDQLKRAAALLRGESGFSFRTLIPSLIASGATATVIAGAIQYVSWLNLVRLQEATDTASAATSVYNETAAGIGQRHYATFTFIPAVSDLVNRKSNADVGLSKSAFDLDRDRFTSYYQMLTNWNVQYDRLITDVEYSLDRPIFHQADMDSKIKLISSTSTDKVDCDRPLIEQVSKIDQDPRSLKAQFAVIAHCLGFVHTGFSAEKDKAIFDKTPAIRSDVRDKYSHTLDSTHSMANTFRCYALQRIQFYNLEKQFSIISVNTAIERLRNSSKQRAVEHLNTVDERCKF